MKKNEKQNKSERTDVKADALSGVSVGVGATIGMVVGNGLAAELNAAETETPVASLVNPEETVKPEEPVKPEQSTTPEQPEVVATEEPDIIVEGCEVVVNPDGTMMEVAALSIDGHEAMIIDGDMDGMADVMAVDMNGNNIVDENEVLDVSEDGLAMAAFREQDYTLTAQTDDDYVNNADVDDYMA